MTYAEELQALKKELEDAKRIVKTLEYDELTGLYTRQAFLRLADEEIRNHPEKSFGILALDLENYKSTNSLYGEDKCNEYLVFISQQLRLVQPINLTGRFGGDQFVVLFESEINYYDLIESYRKAFSKNSPIPNQIVKFGVYSPLDKELLMVRCCDRAFLAIREIKGVYGKNIAVYEDSLQQQILDEQKIVESMEKGLEEGQFTVYYQPKHETVTGKIAGAEALVRWNHPIYGFLAPGKFIPLFEKNGFITKLDTFILETVCKDISKWQNDNLPVAPVSVNISRRDYLESGRIEKQLEIIEKYKIDHNLIHMEVTESMYSENTDLIITKVRDTQESGFLIEMDDFGSGYSSLGSLSSFPLDVIKLDISFVKNIEGNRIVIENIIKMAHRMGLLTIAEGVETDFQFKTLKSLGCDLIQGFYFSKPLPVHEYEAYIRRFSVRSVKNTSKEKISLSSQTNEEQLLMVANEVAEGVPGGFFSYHVDGDLEIISVNKELLTIFECSSAEEFRELTKNSFKNMIYSEDFDSVSESISSQINSENNLAYVECRIKTKSGAIKYVQDFGRFVETEKFGGIFYVFLYDITEEKKRKEAEEKERLIKLELEKSAEIAKQSNAYKNILMSNLAEEITPLVGEIIENTAFIEQNLNNLSELKKCIRLQKSHEEQLLSFVNNLKEIANLEQGKVVLKEVPSDMSQAVMKIYGIFRAEAEKKHIKLECTSEINKPYIYQDIMHTTDVVFNILKNAIKYTPEGGRIKFGLRQNPGENENECTISFFCEDTGIGISKEFLPHIFEAFTREENEINEKIPSSGLGLNIAYKLLSLMNGKMDIISEQGKGTQVITTQPHRLCRKEDIQR